jgi:hypothetical protein
MRDSPLFLSRGGGCAARTLPVLLLVSNQHSRKQTLKMSALAVLFTASQYSAGKLSCRICTRLIATRYPAAILA